MLHCTRRLLLSPRIFDFARRIIIEHIDECPLARLIRTYHSFVAALHLWEGPKHSLRNGLVRVWLYKDALIITPLPLRQAGHRNRRWSLLGCF